MTIYHFEEKPDDVAGPETELIGDHNCKPRAVYCLTCKYWVITDIPGPRCGVCHRYLITYLAHKTLE